MAGIDHDLDNEIYPIDLVEFLQKVMSNLIRNENTYYLKYFTSPIFLKTK